MRAPSSSVVFSRSLHHPAGVRAGLHSNVASPAVERNRSEAVAEADRKCSARLGTSASPSKTGMVAQESVSRSLTLPPTGVSPRPAASHSAATVSRRVRSRAWAACARARRLGARPDDARAAAHHEPAPRERAVHGQHVVAVADLEVETSAGGSPGTLVGRSCSSSRRALPPADARRVIRRAGERPRLVAGVHAVSRKARFDGRQGSREVLPGAREGSTRHGRPPRPARRASAAAASTEASIADSMTLIASCRSSLFEDPKRLLDCLGRTVAQICVSLTEETTSGVIQRMSTLADWADTVQVRGDLVHGTWTLEILRAERGHRVRLPAGGRGRRWDTARAGAARSFSRRSSGASYYVDIEYRSDLVDVAWKSRAAASSLLPRHGGDARGPRGLYARMCDSRRRRGQDRGDSTLGSRRGPRAAAGGARGRVPRRPLVAIALVRSASSRGWWGTLPRAPFM